MIASGHVHHSGVGDPARSSPTRPVSRPAGDPAAAHGARPRDSKHPV